MPSIDHLKAAGERAALRPVPVPPSIDELSDEVGRRRSRKRSIVGGAAAALTLVVAVPLGAALITNDAPDVVTFATENGGPDQLGQAPVAVQPAETTTTTTIATRTTAADSARPSISADGEHFDLNLQFGGASYAIEVIAGDDASSRAATSAAAADSTRTIDGLTIWLDEKDDEVTASALIDDQTFLAVTGPAAEIDQILDLVSNHADGDALFEQFTFPEGMFDGDFPFGPDGLFEDGEWPGLDEAMTEELRSEIEAFSECMRSQFDVDADQASIEVPDCEFPKINADSNFTLEFDVDDSDSDHDD